MGKMKEKFGRLRINGDDSDYHYEQYIRSQQNTTNMQILPEIIETSDRMVDVLEQNEFFSDNPMLDSAGLKYALQVAMQRKWEQTEEMILSDKEFLDICNEEAQRNITETLESLLDKGAIEMGIGEDGEIRYSPKPGFDLNKLNEEDDV